MGMGMGMKVRMGTGGADPSSPPPRRAPALSGLCPRRMRGINAARPSRFHLNLLIRPEPSCPRYPPDPPDPAGRSRARRTRGRGIPTAGRGRRSGPPGSSNPPQTDTAPRSPPRPRRGASPDSPSPGAAAAGAAGGYRGARGQVRPYLIPGGAERRGAARGGAELGEAPARPRAAASRPRPPAPARDFPAPPPPLEGGTGGSPRPPALPGTAPGGGRRDPRGGLRSPPSASFPAAAKAPGSAPFPRPGTHLPLPTGPVPQTERALPDQTRPP